MIRRLHIIDSHTGGEPTRTVVGGFPDLGRGSVAERRTRFAAEFDAWRAAICNEPRGSDVMVGALIVPPEDPTATAGVIFFNNVGPLHMCGHGTIGLIRTLQWQGKIGPGEHRIETSAGTVTATLHPDGRVSLTNVPSWRTHADVPVRLASGQVVHGDVAWGGNWFFLVADHGAPLDRLRTDELTALAWDIRQAINAEGFPEIDHVELFGPPQTADGDSRNFVLCPGKAYDRSPCGTGTSAKLACLAASGKLAEGDIWVQESIIGSTFEGSYRWFDKKEGQIQPLITGTAFVNAESVLVLNAEDPFCWGL